MIKEFKSGAWYKYTGKRKLVSFTTEDDIDLVKCESGNKSNASFFGKDFNEGNTILKLSKELKHFTEIPQPVIMEIMFKIIPTKQWNADSKILKEFSIEHQYSGLIISKIVYPKFTRIVCMTKDMSERKALKNLNKQLKHPDRISVFNSGNRAFYFVEFVY